MIRAKFTIRHNGSEYKKGAIIEGLKSEEEKRLVSLKAAEYIISPDEELKKQQVSGEEFNISQEKFEELCAALDDEYNAEELKREAKRVGVDLAGAKLKEEIIEAIIKQGKADELLEDDTDGE